MTGNPHQSRYQGYSRDREILLFLVTQLDASANIDSFARNCPQMALKCQNHDREWMAHESRMMKLTRRQVFGE